MMVHHHACALASIIGTEAKGDHTASQTTNLARANLPRAVTCSNPAHHIFTAVTNLTEDGPVIALRLDGQPQTADRPPRGVQRAGRHPLVVKLTCAATPDAGVRSDGGSGYPADRGAVCVPRRSGGVAGPRADWTLA